MRVIRDFSKWNPGSLAKLQNYLNVEVILNIYIHEFWNKDHFYIQVLCQADWLEVFLNSVFCYPCCWLLI